MTVQIEIALAQLSQSTVEAGDHASGCVHHYIAHWSPLPSMLVTYRRAAHLPDTAASDTALASRLCMMASRLA